MHSQSDTDTDGYTQAAQSILTHTDRNMTDLVDDDHIEIAQVEANPFQVDNGNSRHGYDCGRGLHKLDQTVDCGHDKGSGPVWNSMKAKLSEWYFKL